MAKEDQNHFLNRELSWIEFNARVLAEAACEGNPLLERLKFAGIVSSNFDEFFMIRAAGLNENDPLYAAVYEKAFQVMRGQEELFEKRLVPALKEAGLKRLEIPVLSARQREYLSTLFQKELLSLLTPIAVHHEQPAPDLVNLSLYRVFELIAPKSPRQKSYAVVEIPKNYPRMITLPGESGYDFILFEDVIALFAEQLFHGYEVSAKGLIRLTRGADMSVDEEKDEDFAKVMEEALRSRRRGAPERVEIAGPETMIDFFKEKLKLSEAILYRASSWMDLKSISQMASHPGFAHLRHPQWVPCGLPEFEEGKDLWNVLSERDVLIHHPYESFGAFVRFLSAAADDGDVLAIKQTLYRSGESSSVIDALERAAENGKQVTVLIELKARFDEERNIEWARRLMDAGATVLYGVAGLKTHAKACLVVRREVEGIKRYLHLATGNYNEKTAKLYSDLGLFTSREELCHDVSSFFNVVTGFSQPENFAKIEVAPFGLRRRLERLILRESLRSRKDQPGLIIAKMNSLVDSEIIRALYRASQQGVQILLNIRGICCLQPGVAGLSENIRVISVVDMFLEHSRIFYFQNGGADEIYLASADWMPRNLDRRLEIMFPVEDDQLKKKVQGILECYFKDNTKAWQLDSGGGYRRLAPEGKKAFRAQTYFCQKALEAEKTSGKAALKDLRPQTPKADSRQENRPIVIEPPPA